MTDEEILDAMHGIHACDREIARLEGESIEAYQRYKFIQERMVEKRKERDKFFDKLFPSPWRTA